MKNVIISIILMVCLFLTGCGNLSPRDNLNPKLDINNQGKIDKIENNQNAIRAEIEKMALWNRENNNSGIQILQGDGALILIFGLVTIFLILYYFYHIAESERKTAEILAQQIVNRDDFELEDNVMKAAQNTDVEKHVYSLIHSEKVKFSLKRKSQN